MTGVAPAVLQPAITRFTGEHEFLSNFSRAAGLIPVEYLYQARKALLQGQADWVMDAATPGDAKRRGRQVRLVPGWDSKKRAVMLELVLAKFSVPALRDKLAATGSLVLVEGNDWGDTFWGAIPAEALLRQSAPIPQFPVWYGDEELLGHNWLGRILMMVRDVTS